MVTKLNQTNYKENVASGVSVVDFNATWCGPCKMLAPVLSDLSEEMTDIKFFAVDVDECPNLAQEYRIVSIPAVAVIKDGKLADINVGFVPKAQLADFISKNK